MSQPPTVERQKSFRRLFVWGLALGTLASALVWAPNWGFWRANFCAVGLLILVVKIGVARYCFVMDRRGFGGGLLVSIPIGCLIFFHSCYLQL